MKDNQYGVKEALGKNPDKKWIRYEENICGAEQYTSVWPVSSLVWNWGQVLLVEGTGIAVWTETDKSHAGKVTEGYALSVYKGIWNSMII